MSTLAAPSFSVVIPTINRSPLLRLTLLALDRQTRRPDEAIVVCDGPDPATENVVAEIELSFPIHGIFLAKNQGQAVARNVGWKHSKGDIVAFLDDDTIPCPEWVSAHLDQYLQKSDERRIVLGALRHSYAAEPKSRLENVLRRWADQRQNHLEQTIALQRPGWEEAAWVGLNTSCPRGLIERLKGFDPILMITQEDAELGMRALEIGATFVYEARAAVEHVSTKDLEQDFPRYAGAHGAAEAYRLRVKGEPIERFPMVTAMQHARLRRRVKEHLAFYAPWVTSRLAEVFRLAGERMDSEGLFRFWAALQFSAAYWRGFRKAQRMAVRQPCDSLRP